MLSANSTKSWPPLTAIAGKNLANILVAFRSEKTANSLHNVPLPRKQAEDPGPQGWGSGPQPKKKCQPCKCLSSLAGTRAPVMTIARRFVPRCALSLVVRPASDHSIESLGMEVKVGIGKCDLHGCGLFERVSGAGTRLRIVMEWA